MGDKTNRFNGQSTLFHTWGSSSGLSKETGNLAGNERFSTNGDDDVSDEVTAALMALEEDEEFNDEIADHKEQRKQLNDRENILRGFDETEGAVWIYPTNYEIRDYQYNIVQKALFTNTLVSLPTGLGKTFIAAVVMYNFYRWYPGGKIVFMAPTKPLVAQQIEACFKVMGIPQVDMCEMTGQMQPVRRENEWLSKRVFFLTPQVVQNDLGRGSCPASDIVCVVVDEAHRALGNHSYTQVIRELSKYTTNFRVLALSATPGDSQKMVQEVITNLMISNIELRSEDCLDIQRYTHKRIEEKFVVKLGPELTQLKDKFLKIISLNIKRLVSNGALYGSSPESLSKFSLLKARDDFHKKLGPNTIQSRGVIEGDFAMAITLYHAYELLIQHGMRSFYHFLKSTMDGTRGQSRTRVELAGNPTFHEIMEELKEKFDPYGTSHASPSKFMSLTQRGQRSKLLSSYGASQVKTESVKSSICSHPKLAKLVEVVLEHFRKVGSQEVGGGLGSRVMIFSQYRESVHEIADVLSVHSPTVRVMTFVGQSSAGKSTRGLTQKEQLQVVHRFRQGGYNTLVATCVGEEGLDIGEVDLIICFDVHASPIRLVQRLGRTGRKRDGRIVVLVTEGKEEKIFRRSEVSKKGINKAIRDARHSFKLYPNNPRMVPQHINPKPCKKQMVVVDYIDPHRQRGGRGRPAKNKEVTHYLSNWGRKGESGFLTDGELSYWSDNFMLPQEDVDRLSKTVEDLLPMNRPLFCLSKSKQSTSLSEKFRHGDGSMSLSRLSDNQTTLSPVQYIGHSMRCHQLIELAQFADMCNDRDEDDDTYSLEMMTYFNDDDVIKVSSKLHLNSLKEKSLEENSNDTIKTVDREKAVVRRKGKKTIRAFSDEEDDFVQCLRARHVSLPSSSEDEENLPRPFQSPGISHEMAVPTTTKADAKHQFSVIGNESSFDLLLPQLSQFDVPNCRSSPALMKSKPAISKAPSIDDTFGGLLSQLPRPELAFKDNKLSISEASSIDDTFGGLSQLPRPELAHKPSISEAPSIDDTFEGLLSQLRPELTCKDNIQVEGEAMGKDNIPRDLAGNNKENQTVMAPAVSNLSCEINSEHFNNQERLNTNLSLSRKGKTLHSSAKCKTVLDISDNQTTTHQMREQPVARNVRQCAAARKLQTFQFKQRETKTNKKAEVNSTFPIPTEPTVIPNSDDEEKVEPVRRLKRTCHNPNVFHSPDTPMKEISKQQETTTKPVNSEESDDDFECEADIQQQDPRNRSKKLFNTKPISSTKSGLNDRMQNRKRQKSGGQDKRKRGSKQTRQVDSVKDFFDEEAVLSDDAAVLSSDESIGSDADCYIADSFIDDSTQPSEHRSRIRGHNSESPLDMVAVYRKSLLSPSCQRGTYKLVFGQRCNGQRLQYSSSELDSSFIDDNALDGSQAEEDNRFAMTEEEEEETHLDSSAVKQDSESHSFVLPGTKGRRKQRQLLDESSEEESIVAVEPMKKSPRLSTVAASSPKMLVNPTRKVLPLLPNPSNQLTPINKTVGELPIPSLLMECQKADGCATNTSQFEMFDDDLDQQLQELDEQILSQGIVESVGAAIALTSSPVNAKTEKPSESISYQPSTQTAKVSPHLKDKSRQVVAQTRTGKMKILVDSKEVSSASQTISTLRLSEQIDPIVVSLCHCDYIVSNRMGVKRVHQSNLSNSSKSARVIDSVRLLFDLFDRPCLIIEKDREKPRDIKPQNRIRTRHCNGNLAALAQTHAKILFSDSQRL
jgi:Fanconi anemia group M protein